MFTAKAKKRLSSIHFTTGFQLVPIQWKMKKKSLNRKKTKHLSEITIYSYSTYLADIDSQRSSIKTDYTSNYF